RETAREEIAAYRLHAAEIGGRFVWEWILTIAEYVSSGGRFPAAPSAAASGFPGAGAPSSLPASGPGHGTPGEPEAESSPKLTFRFAEGIVEASLDTLKQDLPVATMAASHAEYDYEFKTYEGFWLADVIRWAEEAAAERLGRTPGMNDGLVFVALDGYVEALEYARVPPPGLDGMQPSALLAFRERGREDGW